jgi:3-deoxy-D-manno-octulosonic acid (KDO) 8-phosphate synthase
MRERKAEVGSQRSARNIAAAPAAAKYHGVFVARHIEPRASETAQGGKKYASCF